MIFTRENDRQRVFSSPVFTRENDLLRAKLDAFK